MLLRWEWLHKWIFDILLDYCRNISDVLWEAISTNQVLSLYQGLGTKNLQSFISQFIYFYGYSFFKRLYLEKSGAKTIRTKANLIVAAAAGACTVLMTQASPTLMCSFCLNRNIFSMSCNLNHFLWCDDMWHFYLF